MSNAIGINQMSNGNPSFILMLSLTLPMLSLLSSKEQGHKDIWKSSKPYHVGIHWIAPAEHSQMNTHMPRIRSFFSLFA